MADANKRKRLSGFQYRKMSKAKKEREENLVRKTTKLDTYFKIKPNEVHNKVVTDTPTLQVDEKTEEIHNYKINDDMNVDGSNSCDTNEIMSNQVKDQIDIRTVPTSIDFDKKEASQNCKIKNIETNNVDTLETVKCNVKDTNIQYDCWFSNDPAKWVLNESEFEYYSKNQVTTNLVDIQFNKTFRRIVVWTPLLERFDKTSKSLQLINIDLSCVVSLYDSLVCYIQEQRNNFEIFLSEAIKISGINKFSWEETRTKRRNIFFDEEPSGEVIFSNSDKMKNEAFIPIMDALILQLNKRKEAYTKLCDKFGFFSDMENIEATFSTIALSSPDAAQPNHR
ncbi:hypothetical protein ACI65C_006516 [Semiaphis heraclei]